MTDRNHGTSVDKSAVGLGVRHFTSESHRVKCRPCIAPGRSISRPADSGVPHRCLWSRAQPGTPNYDRHV